MAEPKSPGAPSPADVPPPENLEERWKEVIDTLSESPRDVDLLVKAGQLSEQLKRPLEAYTYYRKALTLDPTKGFLVPKMKLLAITPEQREEVTKISRRPTSFAASLNDIFKYPVKGKGLPILILGAIFLWIARALMVNGIGRSGLTIGALAAAYMAMFYIDVCHTTVGGDDELPEWPDPLRFNEFFLDVLKFICATVSAFLPVILLLIFCLGSLISVLFSDPEEFRPPLVPAGPEIHRPAVEDEDDEDSRPAPAASPAPAAPAAPEARPPAPSLPLTLILALVGIVLFSLVGLLYVPMAKLVNVVMGSPWACFNYPFVVHSILATPKNYAICLAMYFGVSLVVGIAEVAVALADVIVFTGVGLAFLELYGMTVLMRLLGLFYRMNQAKLGWMAD
jgi:hypothetical protein